MRDIGKAGTRQRRVHRGRRDLDQRRDLRPGRSDGGAPQATIKAVADARANAETLARAAALHIVGIKSIELGAAGVGPGPMMRMAAAAPTPPTQFDQSNVNVTVSVSVVFLAEP